ncbi:hypothetical protein GJ744_001127 [Endocarpon pusillum]|uniref:Nucleoside phosphorylase domain-containing protein n=1 Tax=Endocarpon pusillum TaxID=364733 RepID=A0A8H7AD34_9EURO|nr:hypothetical protein GJ744_001127 [Endocarpon pusillum]
MANITKPANRNGFSIAIICALGEERDAVMAMLDETWHAPEYGKTYGDDNTYAVGRVGRHKVVVVRLPGMGPQKAAISAATFRHSFPNIRLGLVVGVCGGVPTKSDNGHIMMGDVVLSKRILDYTYTRQYDQGPKIKDTVEDIFGGPSSEIRGFLATMEGKQDQIRLREKTLEYLIEFCKKDGFRCWKFPGVDKDVTFPRSYRHKHQQPQSDDVCIGDACAECRAVEEELNKAQADKKAEAEIKTAERQVKIAGVCDASEKKLCEELKCDMSKAVLRASQGRDPKLVDGMIIRVPEIHCGTIGSGNSVMKSAYLRDELAKERKFIAFEMEGAGVWDIFPTVVIKAVCDYADSHKRKDWQQYASGCAAACMKAFLMEWTTVDEPYHGNVAVPQQRLRVVDPVRNVHWTLTRSANNLFVGRDNILNTIEASLSRTLRDVNSIRQQRFVITGIGGQGKSEICLQLANRVRRLFWGIFWVDVSTETWAESGFLKIAGRLQIPAQTLEEARQGLANVKERWLLVLDNADDPEVDYQRYFPTGTWGVVMLTSRNNNCHSYAPEKSFALDGLSDDEGQVLLLRAADVPDAQRSTVEGDAQVVVSLLNSHPLALIQAGSYVARGHCTLAEYPRVFARQRKRLLAFRPVQARSRYGDVYATFEASAEILRALAEAIPLSSTTESARDALELLPVLATCGPSRVPLLVFKAGWKGAQKIRPDQSDEDDYGFHLTPWHVSRLPSFIQADADAWDSFRLIEAINLCKTFALVSTDTQGGFMSVSMHPLIHAWARDRADATEQHEAWLTTGSLIAISYSDSELWRQHGRQLQSHLQALMVWKSSRMFGSELLTRIISILLECGWLLYKMRDDARLFALMSNLLTHLGLNQQKIEEKWLAVYELTAWNLINYGKVKEALSLLEQIIKIRKQTLAEDHPDRLASQHELAGAYQANGQVPKAVSLLEQVVKIREQTLAEDHPDRLASQHELARAYQANGQIPKAVSLLEQVVKIQEQTLAEDHPSRLASQHELARAYQANGQVPKAVSLLEQVVKIREQTLAEDHPDQLASHHNLATIYWDLGRRNDAVQIMKRVVEIESRVLDEQHPDRKNSETWLKDFEDELRKDDPT